LTGQKKTFAVGFATVINTSSYTCSYEMRFPRYIGVLPNLSHIQAYQATVLFIQILEF